MTVQIDIYTKAWCGYCTAAKTLLTRKQVSFNEIDIGAEPARRDEMIERAAGRRTVPQIFIDGTYVGDCDKLHALEREGKLDALLDPEGVAA